ncbi:MAG TPA: twin transmembrane helix small protein [Gammaproteobacteria bacterium]|nr:twin transmembrane helix small protein [Gammaproteobacteria bacterium]
MKTLIVINFLLILASLASGVFFLVKDDGKSNRVVTSLTVRITLSITLFLLLFAGYYFGDLRPHGING